MRFFVLIGLAALWWLARNFEQRQRIVQLSQALGRYEIEKLMETVMDGYLRAMGEAAADRREQVLAYLRPLEHKLCQQLAALAADVATQPAAVWRISRVPVALPYATQWLSGLTVDARELLALHAKGLGQVIDNQTGRSERERAYMACAELLLLQHTCHWFCRSRSIASARLMARHQTRYAQVVASVSPATRSAYAAALAA
ncbi:hypothetical protein KIK84_05435 [Curvibacter sp. CHRR-16]|nr:hypothetical protein [Curvibacter sp. CHRR-16]